MPVKVNPVVDAIVLLLCLCCSGVPMFQSTTLTRGNRWNGTGAYTMYQVPPPPLSGVMCLLSRQAIGSIGATPVKRQPNGDSNSGIHGHRRASIIDCLVLTPAVCVRNASNTHPASPHPSPRPLHAPFALRAPRLRLPLWIPLPSSMGFINSQPNLGMVATSLSPAASTTTTLRYAAYG